MAVYVYKLRDRSRPLMGRTAPPHPWFGLAADADDELHAFAARLGIRRDSGTAVGSQELVTRHYTLTEGERDRAVVLGAQVIKTREADKMNRQRATMRGESHP